MERRWLPIYFLLMEAAWITGVSEVASARFGGQGLLLTLPSAVLTLFAGRAAGARLLTDGRARPMALLALGLVWSAGAVWLGRHAGQGPEWLEALPEAAQGVWGAPLADALAIGVAFGLWWHGQRTGQAPPEHDSTVRAFGVGALALGSALVWAAGMPLQPAVLPLAALLNLGTGLPALSLARLKEVRRDLEANVVRGQPARLDAAWWRTLTPPVAGVLVLALLAALVFSDDAWRGAILAGMGGVGEAVIAVLYVPVLLIGYLAEWLIYLLRRLRRPAGEQDAPPAAPGGDSELLRQLQRPYEPPAGLESLRWLVLVVAGVVVLAAFLASSRGVRRLREQSGAEHVEREALSFWALLLGDLRALWWAMLRRVRRRAASLAVALPGGGDRTPATADAADAREAYRRLLALGRERAVPRRPHETPDEYLVTWQGALPAAEEAAQLTDTYTRRRYGPPGAEPVEPGRLRALLGRIQAALVTPRPWA